MSKYSKAKAKQLIKNLIKAGESISIDDEQTDKFLEIINKATSIDLIFTASVGKSKEDIEEEINSKKIDSEEMKKRITENTTEEERNQTLLSVFKRNLELYIQHLKKRTDSGSFLAAQTIVDDLKLADILE